MKHVNRYSSRCGAARLHCQRRPTFRAPSECQGVVWQMESRNLPLQVERQVVKKLLMASNWVSNFNPNYNFISFLWNLERKLTREAVHKEHLVVCMLQEGLEVISVLLAPETLCGRGRPASAARPLPSVTHLSSGTRMARTAGASGVWLAQHPFLATDSVSWSQHPFLYKFCSAVTTITELYIFIYIYACVYI